jgi:hypothetical protein
MTNAETKAYKKEWRRTHKAQIEKARKEYYQKNKEKIREKNRLDSRQRWKDGRMKDYEQKYFSLYPWKKNYFWMLKRAKRLGRSCDMTMEQVEFIWHRDDGASMLCPSIDRIDNSKGYTLSNCRFLEKSENTSLGNIGRKLTKKHIKLRTLGWKSWVKKNGGTWNQGKGHQGCSIKDCLAGHASRGLCRRHYNHFKYINKLPPLLCTKKKQKTVDKK